MSRLYTYLRPFASWRFTVSFGVAWMITNGWAYLISFAPLGLPDSLVWVARGYIGFLYIPWTPEKLITVPISIWLHIKLFKNDSKTRVQLEQMQVQAKADWDTAVKKLRKIFKRKKKDA